MNVELLACPITKLSLRDVSRADARAALGTTKELSHRSAQPGFDALPIGETERVLLRSDHTAAYPIVDGFGVLLAPEILTLAKDRPAFDLHDPQYEEAYGEMDFYNTMGRNRAVALREAGSLSEQKGFGMQRLGRLSNLPCAERGTFPHPYHNWLATRIDAAAELDCYEHLAPVAGKRMLQIGGDGEILLRFILAGAAEGVLVTPMIGEACLATETARVLGIGDRLRCVIGVAEELPLAGAAFDGCIAGSCVHHMETDAAFPEINRVLRRGGKFAAFEPWRAPLYEIGTKLFGKREVGVHCRPMDSDRLQPLFRAFDDSRWVLHGTLTRYPLVVLNDKLHMPLSIAWARAIAKWDDRICNLVPGARAFGSSVAMLATKTS